MPFLDELEEGNPLAWGLALVGAYFLLNYWRDSMATAGAGFTASPPADPTFDNLVDIIAPMQVSPAGIAAIMQRETFSPRVMNDAGHKAIGYGHDLIAGDGFNAGSTITRAAAYDLLLSDLAPVAATLNSSLTRPVTQNQFDALASFTFDVGNGAFKKSTLLRKVNQGDYAGASQEFSRWDISEGQHNPGLMTRREGEQNQFDA